MNNIRANVWEYLIKDESAKELRSRLACVERYYQQELVLSDYGEGWEITVFSADNATNQVTIKIPNNIGIPITVEETVVKTITQVRRATTADGSIKIEQEKEGGEQTLW
tara:strand:- start:163 stop:489 length:327 start_codon:yes stop_codon:yes gene_type:complete